MSVALTLVMLFVALSKGQQDTQSVRDLAVAIQESRLDGIRRNCVDQNRRHDATVRTLDSNIAKLPPGDRRTRAKLSRDSTVLLIDALAPRRDCDVVVQRARIGSG
ncbi:MAG: hypothetical protein WKF96_08100 [Solirubrobacteraceae bacterium]